MYFTPFYTVTTSNLALHELVHIHFFATGYLFAWMIAGPDLGPDPPTVPIRIVVLGVAVLGHSVIAQFSTQVSSFTYRSRATNSAMQGR